MTSERRCMIIDLDDAPDAIALYEEWHRPGGPPPAVSRSIRASGIVEMEIFRSGNRLIMIIDVAPHFSAADKASADAADPAVKAWETLMDRFQRPVPWAEPDRKWTLAWSIYKLSDQPA